MLLAGYFSFLLLLSGITTVLYRQPMRYPFSHGCYRQQSFWFGNLGLPFLVPSSHTHKHVSQVSLVRGYAKGQWDSGNQPACLKPMNQSCHTGAPLLQLFAEPGGVVLAYMHAEMGPLAAWLESPPRHIGPTIIIL